MSDKLECPVCGSYSSSVLSAVYDGRPCPGCGASAAVVIEVENLRQQRGDQALRDRVESLLIELDKVTTERNRLRLTVQRVQDALETDL
jgi:hypothetical protein